MSWTRIFRSHHTEYLEKLIEDLKKTHTEEINRVIEENRILREELTKTRYLITPALQSVSLVPDSSLPSPSIGPEFVGTPWQRVLARELKAQEEAAKEEERRRSEANKIAPKGESDGSLRQPGDTAPQRKPS